MSNAIGYKNLTKSKHDILEKSRKKTLEKSLPIPGAGCHLLHCVAGPIDSRTRCRLFGAKRPADPMGRVKRMYGIHRFCRYIGMLANASTAYHAISHLNWCVPLRGYLRTQKQTLFHLMHSMYWNSDYLTIALLYWGGRIAHLNSCIGMVCKYCKKWCYQLAIFNHLTSYLLLILLKQLTKEKSQVKISHYFSSRSAHCIFS